MNKALWVDHEAATVESFRKDPLYAAAYLRSVLEDGNEAEIVELLHMLKKAFGEPCEHSELGDLISLISSMNMKLTVVPKKTNLLKSA